MRGVILTGAGSAFCAGMDLAEMLAAGRAGRPHEQWQADSVVYHDLIEAMLRFPKPLVAAVNGPAVAGGAGLVMACDLVVATRGASLAFPSRAAASWPGMVAPLLAFRVGAARAALAAADRRD